MSILTYGADLLTLIKTLEKILHIILHKMENSMLEITL